MGPDNDNGSDQHAETSPNGRYIRYSSILGKGAYKTVYKAFDTEEALEVAWNKLHVDRLSEHDLEKVSNEVSLLRQVEHKNIIHFYDTWRGEDVNGTQTINFITEQMMSGTLKEYLKKAKAIKLKVIRRWCRNILEAIAYLHSRVPPIMHRDLKCDNIFINGHVGEVKIGDLGLSGVKERDKAESVIGTPEFMAPELYEESYTEKVDIYAFGMCLLEMVTMEYPYSECNNMAQIFKKVFQGEKPRAFSILEDSAVKDVIAACLKREEHRPSAARLLEHPLFKDWEDDDGKASNLSLVKGAPDTVENAISTTRTSNPMPIGTELIDWSDPLNRNVFVSMIEGEHAEGDNQQVSVVAAKDSGGGGFYIGLEIPIRDAIKRVEFTFDPFEDKSQHIAQEMVSEFGLSDEQLHVIRAEIDRQVQMAKEQREAASRHATPQPTTRDPHPDQTASIDHDTPSIAIVPRVPPVQPALDLDSITAPSLPPSTSVPVSSPSHPSTTNTHLASPSVPGIQSDVSTKLLDPAPQSNVKEPIVSSRLGTEEQLPPAPTMSVPSHLDSRLLSATGILQDPHKVSYELSDELSIPQSTLNPTIVQKTDQQTAIDIADHTDIPTEQLLSDPSYTSMGFRSSEVALQSTKTGRKPAEGSLSSSTYHPPSMMSQKPNAYVNEDNSNTFSQPNLLKPDSINSIDVAPQIVSTTNPSGVAITMSAQSTVEPETILNNRSENELSHQHLTRPNTRDDNTAKFLNQAHGADSFGVSAQDANVAQASFSLSPNQSQQMTTNSTETNNSFGGQPSISESGVTSSGSFVSHSASDSQLRQSPHIRTTELPPRPPSTPITPDTAQASTDIHEPFKNTSPAKTSAPRDTESNNRNTPPVGVLLQGNDSSVSTAGKTQAQNHPRPPSISIPKIVVVSSESHEDTSNGRPRKANDSSSSATDGSGESSRGVYSRGASGEHSGKDIASGKGALSQGQESLPYPSAHGSDGKLGSRISTEQPTSLSSGQMRGSSWQSVQSADTNTSATPKKRKSEDGDIKSAKYLTKGLKLMDLCARGRYSDVKIALLNGASALFRDYDKRTPLHVSAGEGHHTVCSLLVENGAEISAKDRWGNTALSDAQENGHTDVVDLLKQHGAEDEDTDVENLELLHFCAQGNVNAVRNRITGGALASFCDYDKRTPLHLACSEGHVEIVEILLVNGASLEALDRKRRSPVDDAISNGRRNVLRLLKKYGAKVPEHLFETDVEQAHRLGTELIHQSAIGYADGVRECLDFGADVNFKDYDQRTALHLACVEGHEEVTKVLLQAGAELNSRDRWDLTPLDDAQLAGHKALLEKIRELEIARHRDEDEERDVNVLLPTTAESNGHGGHSTDMLGFQFAGGISIPAIEFSADDFAAKPPSNDAIRSLDHVSTAPSLPSTLFDGVHDLSEGHDQGERHLMAEGLSGDNADGEDSLGRRLTESRVLTIDDLKILGMTTLSGKMDLGKGARHSVDGSLGIAISGMPHLVEQIGLGVQEGRGRGQVPCSSSTMSLTSTSNGMGNSRGGGGTADVVGHSNLPSIPIHSTSIGHEFARRRRQNAADMRRLVECLVDAAATERNR